MLTTLLLYSAQSVSAELSAISRRMGASTNATVVVASLLASWKRSRSSSFEPAAKVCPGGFAMAKPIRPLDSWFVFASQLVPGKFAPAATPR